MAPDPESATFDGIAYRWSDYDTPLWTRANSSAQRWNTAGEGVTQYVSLTTDGAWGELIRSEELTTVAEVRLVRMPMWGLKLRETQLADYSTFSKAETAGFPPDALVDDDHERCRVEATRLRTKGFRGVLAPSAALPDAINLTLFGPRVRTTWECPDEQRLGSLVPVRQLAVGSPPEDLLPCVRHHDAEHAGLAAYRAGR